MIFTTVQHTILTRELTTTAGHIEGSLASGALSGAPSSDDDTLLPVFLLAFLNHQANNCAG